MRVLDWFHTVGSLVAFAIGAFTLYDRLLRHQPLLSIYAELSGARLVVFLRIKNVAPYDVFVESISCDPPGLGITTSTEQRAMAALIAGDEASVLLAPDEEMLLTVIRFDPNVRVIRETQRLKIAAIWRRAQTRWLRPFPAVLYTSLRDIADRERAVALAGRRI